MEDILRSGFAELGIEPDGKAFERYNTYFEYLEERNAVMNLTVVGGSIRKVLIEAFVVAVYIRNIPLVNI